VMHRLLAASYLLVWVPTVERLGETLHAFGPHVVAALVSAGSTPGLASKVVAHLRKLGVPSVAIGVPPGEQAGLASSAARMVTGPFDPLSIVDAVSAVAA
jgi:hypothetical protein